jgi:hypothetical protein
LDKDSVSSLAEGKSLKKGLLIDFIGNFTRSAREGLPIYRIVGGAGFVWAGSFDQKARGTVRFAAIDASALQPGPEAAEPPAALQNDVRQLSENQPSEDRPSRTQVEVPAAIIDPKRDAEAAVIRLQAELSAAVEAKEKAQLARTQAEKAAQEAKADSEIIRKKLEAARSDATAANNEIDALKAGGGQPVSYAKITLIWISITAALLFLVLGFSKIVASYRRVPKAAEGHIDAVPPSTISQSSTEAGLDEDDLVERMAKALGVQEPVMDDQLHQSADQQDEPRSITGGDEESIPVIYLPDRSSSISSGDCRETPVSIIPGVGDVEEIKSPQEIHATQSENAGSP